MALVLLLALLLPGGGRGAQMHSAELDGRSFTFWDLPLPWESAFVVCYRHGMRLASLGDAELVEFVAKETAGSAWAKWLGGRRGGPESADASSEPWQWFVTSEKVATPPNEWVDSAPPDHCLALAVTPPHLAAIADLPCSTALPFVCERADATTPNLVQAVQLPDRTLTVVESLSTFEEAQRTCQAFNGWLATANKPDLLAAFANISKKLQGAWLGGMEDSAGVMRWSATDQAAELLGERSLLLFEEDSELVVTHDEVTLKKAKRAATAVAVAESRAGDDRKCLMMDRKGALKAADCTTKKSFVCESRSKTNKPITTEQYVPGKRIKVSTHPYTWDEAKEACGRAKSEIANLRKMNEVLALARIPQEFQDLWIDGRRVEDKWVDSAGEEIPATPNEKGYPPWASPTPAPDGADCLIVYRQSPTEALFVPRNCQERHGFACVYIKP